MTDRRQYQREWAARKRRSLGASERVVQGHGTPAAYRRHRRHDEPACEACRKAWADYQRERYNARP
jgi:hypothetical protein